MAVNDVFVMNPGGKHGNVGDRVLMLADGTASTDEGPGTGNGCQRLWDVGLRGKRFAP